MKRIGYNVYRCPEGCDPIFLGFSTNLRGARALQHGSGIPKHLWATARAAGGCGGYEAPETEGEAEDASAWFGRNGDVCAVAVYR